MTKILDIETLIGKAATLEAREKWVAENFAPGSVRLADDMDMGIFAFPPPGSPPGTVMRGRKRWLIPTGSAAGFKFWEQQAADCLQWQEEQTAKMNDKEHHADAGVTSSALRNAEVQGGSTTDATRRPGKIEIVRV